MNHCGFYSYWKKFILFFFRHFQLIVSSREGLQRKSRNEAKRNEELQRKARPELREISTELL